MSRSPSHSFLVARHRELLAPPSRVMSIRLSPTAYRFVCGTGSSWCSPSRRAAIWWSKAKAFRANRPPGRSEAATRSKCGGGRPGRPVQQRAEGAVNQPGRLIEGQVAHITLAQVELHARPGRAARARSSIAGEESMPITRWPVACATGIATRPLPIASSASGPSARPASPA